MLFLMPCFSILVWCLYMLQRHKPPNIAWIPLLQIQTCRYVLLAGLTMMTIPLVVMCFFNDDASLGQQQTMDSSM